MRKNIQKKASFYNDIKMFNINIWAATENTLGFRFLARERNWSQDVRGLTVLEVTKGTHNSRLEGLLGEVGNSLQVILQYLNVKI